MPTSRLLARLGQLVLVLTSAGTVLARNPPSHVAAKLRQVRDDVVLAVPSPAVAAPDAARTPLGVFQVAQPVLGPDGPVYQSLDGQGAAKTVIGPGTGTEAAPSCSQTLMVHSFGWSYGMPFVGM